MLLLSGALVGKSVLAGHVFPLVDFESFSPPRAAYLWFDFLFHSYYSQARKTISIATFEALQPSQDVL